MIGVRISTGRVVFDKRQPNRLMTETLEVIFARRVGRQRVFGTVQQSPVGVVERLDEELALTGVFRVTGRFVVDEQDLERRAIRFENVSIGNESNDYYN